MNRRQFLTASATGGCACLAGCTTDLPRVAIGDGHVFADTTATVGIENAGTTSHNVTEITEAALEFWREESRQYTGFEIDFEIVETDSPDILVRYTDTPEGCEAVENYSEDVLGCAPIIQSGQWFRGTATAIVVAAGRPVGQIRTTTKHELGHILGLGHDDEPRAIMSNRPEDRIPRYTERTSIWEAAIEGHETGVTASSRFNEGITAWRDSNYNSAESAFADAREGFQSALNAFRTARDTASVFADGETETIEVERLESLLDQRIARMEAAVDFAGLMEEAARAVIDGDNQRGDERRREANDRIADYNEISTTELREIAVALGLVRGFERDEEIAPEEQEV